MATQIRLRKIAEVKHPRRSAHAQIIAGSMEARSNPALALASIQGGLTAAQFQEMARSVEAISSPSLILTAARAGMTMGEFTDFANKNVSGKKASPAGAALLKDAHSKREKNKSQ